MAHALGAGKLGSVHSKQHLFLTLVFHFPRPLLQHQKELNKLLLRLVRASNKDNARIKHEPMEAMFALF
jgi:hypothetical protein